MFDLMERDGAHLDDGADPIRRIETGIAALGGEDREQWTSHTLSERVVDLVRVRDRLDAELLRVTGQWDRKKAWEADGSLTPAAWLEHRTRLAPQDARRVVKTARLVDGHQPIGDALAEGDIATSHVDAIARVVSKDRARVLPDHAAILVEQARGLSVRDFTMVMRRWASLADDALATDSHEQKWDRRHLYAAVTLDGWVEGSFRLDPVGGQTLLNRLDHMTPPDPTDTPDGPRTLAQRRADALTHLAQHGHGTDGPVTPPPSLNVVIDVPALSGELADTVASRSDLDGIGPIPRPVFEQLACDCTLTRVVTAGSILLDMGRTARVVTPAQRRALAIRDRHCQFPSCRRSAAWCDAHHILSWLEGGATDLDNLVLLCRRHHTLVHTTRWTITRNPDSALTFTHPARGP
jgi:hypothetical protein